MAKLNTVAHNKKPRTCKICGKPIEIDTPYKWIHPRYRGRIDAHTDCEIPLSMTSSSKMVSVWESQKAVEQADTVEDIAQTLHDLASTAQEVAQEYRDGVENQRQYFPDAGEENEQKADDLESWAEEVESAANEVENIEAEEVVLEREENESSTDYDLRLQDALDEADEKALSEAHELAAIADECPC
jgi:DNA repair exonuclease SbcCD ATPase subunit